MVRLYFPETTPTIRYIHTDSNDAERYRKERDQCYAERDACHTKLKAFETEIGELKAVIQQTKTAIEMNELLILKLRLSNEEAAVDSPERKHISKTEQALKECQEALKRRPRTDIPGAEEHLDKMEVRRRALETVFEAIDEHEIHNRNELEDLLRREDSLTKIDESFLQGLERLAGLLNQQTVTEPPLSPLEPPLSPLEPPLSPLESPLSSLEPTFAVTRPWNCDNVVIDALPPGWDRYHIIGDGNCQFRCIAKCVYSDSDDRHPEVRKVVMDYMEGHADDFRGFVEDNEDWSSYTQRMREDKTFGDHLTLVAAARVYNVNFVTFKNENGRYHVTCTRSEYGQPVTAEYWLYLANTHYDLLTDTPRV